MNGLRALWVALSGLLPFVGCGGDGGGDVAGDGRIGPILRGASQSNVAALNLDYIVVHGEHFLHVLDEPGASTGRLKWAHIPPEGMNGRMTFVAWQDLELAPHGTRYLLGSHFTSFDVTLELDGVSYVGFVLHFELHADLLMWVHHGAAEILFEPIDGDGEPIEFAMQHSGYAMTTCSTTSALRRETSLDIRYPDNPAPPACAAVFDQIRATPDDPDAPPAPYDLYGDDVIDSGEGDAPSVPIAPLAD